MSRESLLSHVVDVITEDGISGLSVRAVASRAGVAIGTVQHWFPTKRAMLLAAMDRAVVVAGEAGERELTSADPAARLRAMVALLVPSNRDTTVTRVWLAFAAHAVVDEQVRKRYEQLWSGTQRAITGLLAAAAPHASAASLDEAAAELLALTDGLAIAVLDEPGRMPPARAAALAARRTDEILAALHG